MPTMAEQTRINRSHAISATSKTCIDKMEKIQLRYSFGSLKIKITEEIYDKTIFIDFPILEFCFTG